jgi:transposase
VGRWGFGYPELLPRARQADSKKRGSSWAIVQILRRHVDRVVVADPAQLKALASARIKTNKVDAHILAQLQRLDFLPEVTLPTRLPRSR